MSEQLASDIEVVVLAHQSKPAITAETLGYLGIPYRLFDNPDWEWPEDHPELLEDRTERPILRGYALRQFRAFRGHQEIMRTANPNKFTLVFEDDMTLADHVTPEEMIQHINGGVFFISRMGYDAVSYHARGQTPPLDSICYLGREYVELSTAELPEIEWGHRAFLHPVVQAFNGKYENYRFKWHEGCLAYLAGPRARVKWSQAGHGDGMPCDLFLANELRTLVMRHSLFNHDQRHGSLIANTGSIQKDLNDDGTAKAD